MALIKIKQINNLQTELDTLTDGIVDLSVDSKDTSVLVVASGDATTKADAAESAANTYTDNGIIAASIDSKDTSVLAVVAGNLAGASIDSKDASVLAAAESYADGLESTMDGRVTAIEGVILEDNEFFTERFTAGGLSYTVANSVQDNNVSLVWAFVNGIHVQVASVSGTTVVLSNPGYTISGDTVTIKYQGA